MMPSTTKQRSNDAEEDEPAVVSSQDLLGGQRQVIIQHGREQYRLLVTASNKLILTK